MQKDGNIVINDIVHGEYHLVKNIEVKNFIAVTKSSRRLEMAVSTTPSGYINIMQHGHSSCWDYNFTAGIRITSEGK